MTAADRLGELYSSTHGSNVFYWETPYMLPVQLLIYSTLVGLLVGVASCIVSLTGVCHIV